MSLVPYREGSVILGDPSSRSLVIVNPSSGSLEFYRKIYKTGPNGPEGHGDVKSRRYSIASYVCPRCGTEIHPRLPLSELNEEDPNATTDEKNLHGMNLSRKYFHFLEDSHKINESSASMLPPPHPFFIPQELFIPGYFHKFFRVLSLLGSGARGSVFKVVHRIGDIDLGVFALKKIPIGNDMVWFQKCIREVKALSSLTHMSANLITYNHVWLEMDAACGLVRTLNGEESDTVQDIPCIFILQQYCSGGNLENFILKDVFHKFADIQSPEERKRLFRFKRTHSNVPLGLSTEQIVHIMRDIARGIHELHDIGIIHRDLKPSNCLLLKNYSSETVLDEFYPTIVIGDLGESQKDGEYRSATGATGTLEFTAPELIISGKTVGYREYSFASDIYAIGMVCYFVVFGELPFEPHMEIKDLKSAIKGIQFDKEILLEQHASLGLRPIDGRVFELMELLLSKDYEKRPSAKEVELFLDEIWISLDLDNLPESLESPGSDGEETLDDIDNQPLVPISDGRPDPSVARLKTTPSLWGNWLCILTNVFIVASMIFSSSQASILVHMSLILLGVSIRSSLRQQRWLLVILLTTRIYLSIANTYF
ncbi:hypothetical protein ZYGR_0BB01060 [Zygosaccharomyces rouxii]|uniref:Protein kinase domain-containing protein n=1 Tax=Zygosaccharomyces rouxii TaxID=4956 RepID=A0A1Q3AKR9_ZYGRO|nr:hypothetical protein ZYGR_0BB01060 [Zygosaccharomyces rouxii]